MSIKITETFKDGTTKIETYCINKESNYQVRVNDKLVFISNENKLTSKDAINILIENLEIYNVEIDKREDVVVLKKNNKEAVITNNDFKPEMGFLSYYSVLFNFVAKELELPINW